MKFMSDGLQAVAGDVIRKIINSLNNNIILAVGVGLLVTCIIQSSSVTTVMTVGFVNAGTYDLEASDWSHSRCQHWYYYYWLDHFSEIRQACASFSRNRIYTRSLFKN